MADNALPALAVAGEQSLILMAVYENHVLALDEFKVAASPVAAVVTDLVRIWPLKQGPVVTIEEVESFVNAQLVGAPDSVLAVVPEVLLARLTMDTPLSLAAALNPVKEIVWAAVPPLLAFTAVVKGVV